MSDWWLKNIFDAYDKSRQKVEDIGTFTAEAMLSMYNGAKIALKDVVVNKGGNDKYNDNLGSEWGVDKLYTSINSTAPYDSSILEKFHGILKAPMFRIGAGLITAGLVMYATRQLAVPSLPQRVKGDKEVLLVVGEMSDPITRSLVYDMYRRGFCVFICSTKDDKESLEDEYEKIPSPWDHEDGLYHINSSVLCLTRFLEHLEQENKRLRGIVVIPNVSYYTSGVFTNHSAAYINSELNTNFMNIWRVLTKLLPHFNTSHKDRLKIVVFNPSLSKNLNLHYHSLELIISSLMDSLYRIMSNECGQLADVYQCNLGVLNVAGNASNYKYLCVSGTPITKSLCEPIYELLISTDSIWFRFKRWMLGPALFCGKGAWITYYLKNWAPVWLLEMI